ncbi:hypothetical protein BABINDRAFT_159427 [Babjeviella inositovora NRRL Y-12698]|uniref:Choline kinase N-terminal domain-containing protein n=1 Tax=Babjeviella inositovora NRRL Y-12698 TaxID=984486 RepID=A0A1E3R0P1_9ASCO|nr:uncharacterized protein BABINDRAFT_159427 [Babjeviella inositovora NRRL Y-12698]ODQ82947.1 hypothetical protein BABINDRAFT_159427 [Babjeviella inositovora NRRL Y-12698]
MDTLATEKPRSRSRSMSRSRSRSNIRPVLTPLLSSNQVKQVPRRRSHSRRPSLSRQSSGSVDEVPHIKANLDNSLPLDFMKEEIMIIVKALRIKHWHKLPESAASRIKVNRISGALTNSIYKLNLDECPALLLRVYGKNVDEIIDREAELIILKRLSSKRIGPRLLGTFTNGRFEQFLDGFITLNKDQLRNKYISQMIAKRMKELHVNMELEAKDTHPMSWALIDKWFPLAEEVVKSYEANPDVSEADFLLTNFATFKKNVQAYRTWLMNKYGKAEFPREVLCFCHNDTQYGNLLLHSSLLEDSKTEVAKVIEKMESLSLDFDSDKLAAASHSNLVVIDLEYSGPNCPPFEFANHFSEWMADYLDATNSHYLDERKYPTTEEQLNFFRVYTEFSGRATDPADSTRPDEAATKKLFNETIWWRGTVSVYWCLWGIVQNGPWKPTPTPEAATGEGFLGTYKFSTETEEGDDQGAEVEITESSDDAFSYIRYSQQKAAMFYGDAVQLGIVDRDAICERYLTQGEGADEGHVKFLSVKELD